MYVNTPQGPYFCTSIHTSDVNTPHGPQPSQSICGYYTQSQFASFYSFSQFSVTKMSRRGDNCRRTLVLLTASAVLLFNFGVGALPFWRERSTSEDSDSARRDLNLMCPLTSEHRNAFAEHVLSGTSAPWRPMDAKGGENQREIRSTELDQFSVQRGRVRVQHIRGVEDCQNSTNNVSAGLTHRALCPWKWEFNIDPMVRRVLFKAIKRK